MKKILFSAYCANFIHKYICEGLIEMLESREFTIDILSNVILNNLSSQLSLENTSEINNYDAVISFNKRGYHLIRKHIKNRHIPHIYIFCNNEIETEYVYDLEAFDQIIIIKYVSKQIPFIYMGEHITSIGIPFKFSNIFEQPQDEVNTQILVHISDNETLLTIIPILNSLQGQDILIYSNKKNVRAMLAPNIRCLMKSPIDLSDQISISKLIIGDGSTILNGLLNKKSSIVLGNRGIGGFVTKENIEIQFKSGFHGRVGADIGEYIPQSLILEEIKKGIQQEKNDSEYILSFLDQEYQKIASKLYLILNKSIRLRSSKIWNLKFRKSKQFGYYKTNNSESILIIDLSINKMLCLINQEEFRIVECFKEAVTPLEIFNALELGNTNDYDNFIFELISNKLIYNDET